MTWTTSLAELFAVPLTLDQANDLVDRLHRHHKKVQGHRFSIGAMDRFGRLVGCCICGRPVGRLSGDPSKVLEVTRLVTDGTPNACSFLYGAAARAAKAMGFEKIQTFILDQDETGVSLKASGYRFDRVSRGGQWKHSDGKVRRSDQPNQPKAKWFRELNTLRPDRDPLMELLG